MIDRRGFLAGSIVATAAPAAAAQTPRRAISGAADVVVIGAGAFGGWAALCLRERGAEVVSIDAYGPSSPRSASAGETRSIRSGYGEQGFYSAWSIRALALWKAREQEFGRRLLYPCDRIEIAQVWSPHLRAQRAVFDEQGIPYRILSQRDLERRWPQMNFDDIEFGFYETPETAGLLRARESMLRASEVFQSKGGRFRIGRAAPGEAAGRNLNAVTLGDGDTVAGGQFVFACGPWSPQVFPQIMGRKVRVSRSEYYYWGVPAGDSSFSWPAQPIWHDEVWGGYGFPSIERGLKYSPRGNGSTEGINPDQLERLPDPSRLANGRRHIAHRFPRMAEAPVVESRVCQTESTADSDFIIDRHPDYDNVWLASGGGGHAFKFGPLLGEHIADRVLGAEVDPDIAARFAWAGRPDQT